MSKSLVPIVEMNVFALLFAFIIDATIAPSLIGPQWSLTTAITAMIAVFVLVPMYINGSRLVRIYQERVADIDAVTYIGDALAYIDLVEKLLKEFKHEHSVAGQERLRYLYRLDAQHHNLEDWE